jgi:hypothetical protein
VDVVAVVVGHVLAPQPVALGERVLVAVRVRDAHEPELVRVHERRDFLAGRRGSAVVVDEVVERPPAGLARQPLARVLKRVVEHRRPAVVRGGVGVLRDLQRDDVAPEDRVPDVDLLDDVRVLGDHAVVLLEVLLLAVARHTVEAGPDVKGGVAAGVVVRVSDARLGADLACADTLLAQLGGLAAGREDLDEAAVPLALGDVVPGEREALDVGGRGLHPEAIERRLGSKGRLRGQRHQQQHERRRGTQDTLPHRRPSDPLRAGVSPTKANTVPLRGTR